MKAEKMEESINQSHIYRFLEKETTELENNEILHWVSESEDNKAEFRRIHKLHHLSNLKHFQANLDVDDAWNKLFSRMPKVIASRKVFTLDIFRKIAVAVIIVLAVGGSGLWTIEHFLKGNRSAIVQFEAPKGEKSKIVLADGTLVWLNSQTILKYDALNPRKVNIEGEAYFEVKKDPAHPFEVSTPSGLKIKVTGTRFNLRSFANESFVATTLEEGQVIITGSHNHQSTVLKPGQQAKYDIQRHQLSIKNVSTKLYSLWKNNELRFSDVSFTELVPQIERWYGVSIQLDPLISKDDRFTMTIKTESLRELLSMMKLTSKFDYEINGALIEIYAK